MDNNVINEAIAASNAVEKEEEKVEYPLPDLFNRADDILRGTEVKVTVKDLSFKPIKSAQVKRLDPNQKLMILKMGGKTKSFSTYYPIIVGESIFTCVTKDVKKKLVLFVFVGPYSKLNEIVQRSGAPVSVED